MARPFGTKKENNKNIILNVRLDKEYTEKLNKVLEVENIDKSKLVRNMIEEKYKSIGQQEKIE